MALQSYSHSTPVPNLCAIDTCHVALFISIYFLFKAVFYLNNLHYNDQSVFALFVLL